VLVALLLPLAIGVAAFPWGVLDGFVARRLSTSFGRPVTIGSLERIDRFGFTPTLRIGDLRIPQARWAGGGDLARLRRADVTLPVWPLLIGHVRPQVVRIDGLGLRLVRAKDGRESWRKGPTTEGEGGGSPHLGVLTIAHSRVVYQDAKRDRSADVALEVNGSGVRITGTGRLLDAPVRIDVRGPAIGGDGRWPFTAAISGAAIDLRVTATADRALDIAHLDARVTARATNLSYIDAIIEAGLPRTQPVRLSARVRRDGRDWRISALSGMIGRSDITGNATIRKRDGRHLIDGTIRAKQFDFDDLSDARGHVVAAAKRARAGKRLFPDTAIDLDESGNTDGTLRLHAARLLWPGPSPFRSLDGTLRLDRSRLTIDDLRLGLIHGSMVGRVEIDQRGMAPGGRPMFRIDLRLRDGRLMDFAPDAGIDGAMAGRMKLAGPGRTIRAAIGSSTGHIAIVARDGVLPARTAELLGQDLVKGLLAAKDKEASLRCIVMRLDATNGLAIANPMLIDTGRARTDVKGRILLNGERLDLAAQGLPKGNSALRLQGTIGIGGTIKAPAIMLPAAKGGKLGLILKSIGRAIDDKPEPMATDADCNALAQKALAF